MTRQVNHGFGNNTHESRDAHVQICHSRRRHFVFYETRRPDAGLCEIWDEVPISLSVVPFHGRTLTQAIPPEYRNGGSESFPINPELVAFLHEQTTNRRVSIMMHGYSHVDEPGGYEFQAGTDLERKVREGKRYLERVWSPCPCLRPASQRALGHWIPRSDTRRFGYRSNRPFRTRSSAYRAALFAATDPRRIFEIHVEACLSSLSFVLDFGSHREVAHHSLTSPVAFQKLLAELEFCHNRRGIFVLATHYWELDRETRDGLILRRAVERLVTRARELGACFCTVNQVLGRE